MLLTNLAIAFFNAIKLTTLECMSMINQNAYLGQKLLM